MAAGLFSVLPDELIIQVLEFLQKVSLLQLGSTCKALYAFCTFDDLWKSLLIGYVWSPVYPNMRLLNMFTSMGYSFEF